MKWQNSQNTNYLLLIISITCVVFVVPLFYVKCNRLSYKIKRKTISLLIILFSQAKLFSFVLKTITQIRIQLFAKKKKKKNGVTIQIDQPLPVLNLDGYKMEHIRNLLSLRQIENRSLPQKPTNHFHGLYLPSAMWIVRNSQQMHGIVYKLWLQYYSHHTQKMEGYHKYLYPTLCIASVFYILRINICV